MHDRYNVQKGFTLIELMVVLVIVGILLTFAIPNFNEFMQRSRLRSSVANVQSTINLARSRAIQLQTSMEIRPQSGSWDNGWKIYEDGETTAFRSISKPYADVQFTGGSVIRINPSGILSPINNIGTISIGSHTVKFAIVANRLCNNDTVESPFLQKC